MVGGARTLVYRWGLGGSQGSRAGCWAEDGAGGGREAVEEEMGRLVSGGSWSLGQ